MTSNSRYTSGIIQQLLFSYILRGKLQLHPVVSSIILVSTFSLHEYMVFLVFVSIYSLILFLLRKSTNKELIYLILNLVILNIFYHYIGITANNITGPIMVMSLKFYYLLDVKDKCDKWECILGYLFFIPSILAGPAIEFTEFQKYCQIHVIPEETDSDKKKLNCNENDVCCKTKKLGEINFKELHKNAKVGNYNENVKVRNRFSENKNAENNHMIHKMKENTNLIVISKISNIISTRMFLIFQILLYTMIYLIPVPDIMHVLSLSFWKIPIFLFFYFFHFKSKYYLIWTVSNLCHHLSLLNVKAINKKYVELSLNSKEFLLNWNVYTNLFLKNAVFKTFREYLLYFYCSLFQINKTELEKNVHKRRSKIIYYISSFLTFMYSSIWHGIQKYNTVTFISFYFLIYGLDYFQEKAYSYMNYIICIIINYALLNFLLVYYGFSFIVKDVEKTLLFYEKVYYIGHFVLFFMIVARIIL